MREEQEPVLASRLGNVSGLYIHLRAVRLLTLPGRSREPDPGSAVTCVEILARTQSPAIVCPNIFSCFEEVREEVLGILAIDCGSVEELSLDDKGRYDILPDGKLASQMRRHFSTLRL